MDFFHSVRWPRCNTKPLSSGTASANVLCAGMTPALKVTWPLERAGIEMPKLAPKDEAAPLLAELEAAGDLF